MQKRIDAGRYDRKGRPAGRPFFAPDAGREPATGVPKVLFVRYGQDATLFDETTLHLQ
jgi:hypothetical protein